MARYAELSQCCRCVVPKNLECVCHLVFDSLAGWLRARPQFEIRRSVVETVAVVVMDGLIRQERSAEHLRHNQSVFRRVGCALGEMSKCSGNANVAVAVLDVALVRAGPNRNVCLNVAGAAKAAVVNPA